MRTKWPSPQDFNEAIQNPQSCFADPNLRSASVAVSALGLPKVESGNFANVYKLTCTDGVFAVRCFTQHIADAASRYAHLSDFILSDDLIYTVTFDFKEQGIRIGKDWFPIVKMEWVEGDHFLPWIDQNIDNPQAITQLADNFLSMTSDLQDAGIAHGDLQHGNIIIVNNDFRLVDYDGMFVPAMAGMHSNELGHSNYQHPDRRKEHFGPYLDNFSAWLIFASLEIIAREPRFWHEFGKPNGETILFTAADLRAPDKSALFKKLVEHKDADISLAANSIIDLLSLPPEQVPPPAVTHRNLKFGPIKEPSWMDKLLRRAKKMVNRFAPRPAEKPTPVPVVVTTIVENPEPIHRPTRALPSWLDDWIAQAPPPPPITPLPSAAPNTSPPTERALPQHPVPLHLPQTHTAAQLHDYDIWRLLSRARKYSEAGAFSKAKRLLGEAQHAAKAGGYPALIIEALRVEAQIMSGEANMHRDAHRFYEATTLYEKAIGAMRLARQLRSGKPERLDDISESHYLVSLASIHKDHGRELEAIQALNEAVALLKRHPNLKAEIARIQKLLPTGNNAP